MYLLKLFAYLFLSVYLFSARCWTGEYVRCVYECFNAKLPYAQEHWTIYHSWWLKPYYESLLMTNGFVKDRKWKWKSWTNQRCCPLAIVVVYSTRLLLLLLTSTTHQQQQQQRKNNELTDKYTIACTRSHTIVEWKNFEPKLTKWWMNGARRTAIQRIHAKTKNMFYETQNILIIFSFGICVRNINNTHAHRLTAHSLLCCHWQLLCANGKCFSCPYHIDFYQQCRDYVRAFRRCVCVRFYLFGSPGTLTSAAFNLYIELIALSVRSYAKYTSIKF